eukprot:g19292.t1
MIKRQMNRMAVDGLTFDNLVKFHARSHHLCDGVTIIGPRFREILCRSGNQALQMFRYFPTAENISETKKKIFDLLADFLKFVEKNFAASEKDLVLNHLLEVERRAFEFLEQCLTIVQQKGSEMHCGLAAGTSDGTAYAGEEATWTALGSHEWSALLGVISKELEIGDSFRSPCFSIVTTVWGCFARAASAKIEAAKVSNISLSAVRGDHSERKPPQTQLTKTAGQCLSTKFNFSSMEQTVEAMQKFGQCVRLHNAFMKHLADVRRRIGHVAKDSGDEGEDAVADEGGMETSAEPAAKRLRTASSAAGRENDGEEHNASCNREEVAASGSRGKIVVSDGKAPQVDDDCCGPGIDDDDSTEASVGFGGGESDSGSDAEEDANRNGDVDDGPGVLVCGAAASRPEAGVGAGGAEAAPKRERRDPPPESEDEASEEESHGPPKKKRKDESPFLEIPIDEVEPLLGHRQIRTSCVNMWGAEVHSEKLNWIVDVAGWRRLDVVLLSEFAYTKKRGKAATKKRFERRLRNSARDEESSDDDENDADGAAEYADPIASKGTPTWILRRKFDLLYINGCGIMLFNRKLREQAKRIRDQGQRSAIRSETRTLALYLPELILAATYAPTISASKIEQETYDSDLVSVLQEMKKRRKDKWKLRAVAGDINAHVGREEFGESVVHLGVGGASETNARGRTFAKVLMATNSVLVSSKFAIEGAVGDEAYYTYMGKADLGKSEVDHYIAAGAHLSKYRAYRRVDYSVPNEVEGVSQARGGGYDHLAVEAVIDVRTRRRLHEEGEARALASREILEVVDPHVLEKFNSDLKRRVAVAGDEFHLEDFQDFLIEWVDDLSGKRCQQPPPEEIEPEELEESGKARSGMWKLFREQKLEERPKSTGKGGITAKQAKAKYDQVGNTPLHPDRDDLPISDQIADLVTEFSDEIKAELAKPVTSGELKRAATHLKQGGKAKDVHGLGANILLKLDEESLELMTRVVQRELESRDFHSLSQGMHLCRDVSLYKGKGPRNDPDGYRFLVISPLITKLLVRVMSERLRNALEKSGFFSDTQFGFRRRRGTHDSMLIMNRLREDMKNYRLSDALRLFVVLVDLKKALPSLDWRLVRGVVASLGIEETKLWEVLDATHRSAEHTFGEGFFRLEHGCKEGGPSSPLLFIMAFTVVMKHFKKKLEQQRQEKGEAAPHGAPLYVREEARHLAREDKLLQLGLGEKPGRVIDYVLDFLSADDTTLVQRLRAEEAREVEEHDAQALKEETPLMPLEVVSLFGEVLTECGLRENESKRVQADVATIVTRNLGMDIDPEQDCRNKIRKAWQAIRLRFLQSRHFAHVMRMPKDRITRKALVGKFIPPGVRSWDGAADWMSAGAMEMHAKAHLRDDYTKISQICRRVKGEDGKWHKVPINEYRPEQHQLHPNGHTFAGSDTCLDKSRKKKSRDRDRRISKSENKKKAKASKLRRAASASRLNLKDKKLADLFKKLRKFTVEKPDAFKLQGLLLGKKKLIAKLLSAAEDGSSSSSSSVSNEDAQAAESEIHSITRELVCDVEDTSFAAEALAVVLNAFFARPASSDLSTRTTDHVRSQMQFLRKLEKTAREELYRGTVADVLAEMEAKKEKLRNEQITQAMFRKQEREEEKRRQQDAAYRNLSAQQQQQTKEFGRYKEKLSSREKRTAYEEHFGGRNSPRGAAGEDASTGPGGGAFFGPERPPGTSSSSSGAQKETPGRVSGSAAPPNAAGADEARWQAFVSGQTLLSGAAPSTSAGTKASKTASKAPRLTLSDIPWPNSILSGGGGGGGGATVSNKKVLLLRWHPDKLLPRLKPFVADEAELGKIAEKCKEVMQKLNQVLAA